MRYYEQKNWRKARVIKEVNQGGVIRRETLVDGICVGETSLGAFIYDKNEQEGNFQHAEWYPYNAPVAGIKTIVYL